MQGLFVNYERPNSKKAVKEAITANPMRVRIEATSLFGNEYDGALDNMPDGEVHFVGPDPHTNRKFYGTITKRDGKYTVK